MTDPNGMLDDAALLARAAADPSCFSTFYRRHREPVLHWILARTADPHTTVDIHAETFATAYTKRVRFDPQRAVSATGWLCGIAANELRRTWRNRHPSDRVRRQLAIPHLPLDDLSYERIEERFDTEWTVAALQSVYDQLTPTLAEAVTLRVADGLDFRQVADQLGCRAGTARIRVSRGLSQLHDLMERR